MGDLQRLADSLGRSTRRAVAIHDAHGRIVAYSSQDGPVDEVRTRSIMGRHIQSEAVGWIRSLGVDGIKGPVRLPASPDRGMLPRICAPVYFDGKLLGVLWLIDPDESLPDEALGTVAAAADTAGIAIHRDQLVRDLDRRYERELLRALLVGAPTAETTSAAFDIADPAHELVERNILTAGSQVVAVVVRPGRDDAGAGAEPTDGGVRLHLEQALEEVRAATEPGQAAYLVRHDHAVLALAGDPDRLARLSVEAAERIAERADVRDHWGGWALKCGVGEVAEGLKELHRSYAEARSAAEIAWRVAGNPTVVRSAQLGAYRTLLALPVERLNEDALHPGLHRLMGLPDAALWLHTLEEWLDHAGCAQSTAAALGVNRGTVYYRLRRIEDVTGADLRRGDDRLALHLGLKLVRLGRLACPGSWPGVQPGSGWV